ncbi:helix-turn-helix domain-containing protein [Tessaracoccus sp.]|uniref:helix-turn-helix domain-containing protein n=1 Tax=Tessaracoccus sp. TaxID=1971211 RepID=UPI0026177DE4|nr:AraC family transcriptional regulator [Tessaracoccus sp.]
MPDDDAATEGLYEERVGASPHVECTWQARAVREERYLVPAIEHWDIWFAREPDGRMVAGLSGPALGSRWIASVVGEYGWGVQLRAHVVVPGVAKKLLLGGEVRLPVAGGQVEISGQRLPMPSIEGLEDFVEQLLRLGVLRSDDDVRRALAGDEAGYSERHWQRQVRASTGITRKQISQLARAREAYALLQGGVVPAECAATCGYADQAHLTRSLRLLHGETPARILAARRA